MLRSWLPGVVLLLITVELAGSAETNNIPPLITGKLTGCVLAGGSGRVMILDPQGNIKWEHPAGLVHDAWMLPGGNVLYADGATVTEVTPAHKVVFCYKAAEQRGGGTFSCQRLADGRTLVGENSTGRVLEIDPAGKRVFQLQTAPAKTGNHHNFRMVRKLDDGHYLVCHSGSHVLKEYAADGTVVRELKMPNLVFAAVRTPAGTTLVSLLDRLQEYDAAGKVVWELKAADLPGATVRNMTGLHLLPSGNIAVGCYSAYKDGEGTGLLEITRDRTVAWRYANPIKDRSLMAVQLLTPDCHAVPGECRR